MTPLAVLIEPTENNRFRAKIGQPFELSATGTTSEEALCLLNALVQERLQATGTPAATIEVPGSPGENPWTRFAGDMKEDPLFDAWQEAIRAYRRQDDEESGAF